MGNFLASPITEKETQTGEGNGLTYGISTMQGWRTSMEDSHVAVVDPQDIPTGNSIFAVCDGHGGKLAAELAAEKMVGVFARIMKKNNVFVGSGGTAATASAEQIGKSMRDAFMALDEDIRKSHDVQYGTDQSGCTAIAAFITSTHIIVANTGDSRSVLAKGGKTVEMSKDHKPINPIERARIEKAGGLVRSNRVNGDLAVSRALGDFSYKQNAELKAEDQQVSAEPEIKCEPLDKTEEFLVIACDGIWDVMSNDEVCNFVRTLMNLGESNMGLIAEEIVDSCLRAGSRDNMSVVIVKFPGAKIGVGEGVKGVRRERERLEAEANEHADTEDDQKD